MEGENHPEILDALWEGIMEFSKERGLIPIKDKVVDERFDVWRLIVNGTRETVEIDYMKVAPFNAFVEFNGWPWAYFGPESGQVGIGEAANHETFLAALKAACKP